MAEPTNHSQIHVLAGEQEVASPIYLNGHQSVDLNLPKQGDENKERIAQQMAKFAEASEVGDIEAFVKLYKEIDWMKYSANDLCCVIRMALNAGAYFSARTLAMQGAERYPDHAGLQEFVNLIGKPKKVRATLAPNETSESDRRRMEQDRQWLLTHSQSYRHKWVALQAGELLAVADSLTALTEQIATKPNILFTQVY